MRRKEEPAQALLTMTPTAQTSLRNDGFLSALYEPSANAYPGKALILAGGSDGYFSLTKLIAEQYAGRGLTVLALAYWNQEGLPMALSRIPLEYAELAALWLRGRGYEKIAMAGISMGAEYALLCSAYFPELLSCCVAISPISISTQGIQKKTAHHRKMNLLEGPVFTYREQDLPYGKLTFHKKTILLESLKAKEPCMLSCYRDAVENPQRDAEIPVENISGSLLLLAADRDSRWPSAESAERIVRRRAQYGLDADYCHYAYASHLLVPWKLKSRKMFRMERNFPEKCWKSNVDAFQKTLLFLRNSW